MYLFYASNLVKLHGLNIIKKSKIPTSTFFVFVIDDGSRYVHGTGIYAGLLIPEFALEDRGYTTVKEIHKHAKHSPKKIKETQETKQSTSKTTNTTDKQEGHKKWTLSLQQLQIPGMSTIFGKCI